jgi:hypothetical protein
VYEVEPEDLLDGGGVPCRSVSLAKGQPGINEGEKTRSPQALSARMFHPTTVGNMSHPTGWTKEGSADGGGSYLLEREHRRNTQQKRGSIPQAEGTHHKQSKREEKGHTVVGDVR